MERERRVECLQGTGHCREMGLCVLSGVTVHGSHTTVVQSDSSRFKGVPEALSFSPGWDDPVAERAARLPQLIM